MHQPASALLLLIRNGSHQPPPFDEPSRARELYQSAEHSTPSLNGFGGHGRWCIITESNWEEKHWLLAVFTPSEQQFRAPLKFGRGEANPTGTRAPSSVSTMPRLRGKPRRGTAWYRAESRRQRHRKFERALALASTRRRRATMDASHGVC
jgi:hypothetical protein